MRIEECEFPDDVWYDEDGLAWARRDGDEVVVGATAILAALAGRLVSVRGKPPGTAYARGTSIGTLESGTYFGVLRTPVTGTLVAVNDAVLRRPRLLSEDPYGEGWFARVRPDRWDEESGALKWGEAARSLLAAQIAALRVHCFAALPDREMVEVGTECAAVLTKLDALLAGMEIGEVVHVVSDDWTGPPEIARWSEQTGNPVLETRREGELYHYLIRKARR